MHSWWILVSLRADSRGGLATWQFWHMPEGLDYLFWGGPVRFILIAVFNWVGHSGTLMVAQVYLATHLSILQRNTERDAIYYITRLRHGAYFTNTDQVNSEHNGADVA